MPPLLLELVEVAEAVGLGPPEVAVVTLPLPPAPVAAAAAVALAVVALVVCDEIALLPPAAAPPDVEERKSLAFWRELAELLALLPLLL